MESRGLKVWMDITRLGKAGVTQDIVNVCNEKHTLFIVLLFHSEFSLIVSICEGLEKYTTGYCLRVKRIHKK